MENLPTELINIILEYQGYHQLRCGKYIRSIYIDDEKYNSLKKKPIVTRDKNNIYKVTFKQMKYDSLNVYTIQTFIKNNKIHWSMIKSWYYKKNGNGKKWSHPYEKKYDYVNGNNVENNNIF